MISSFDTVECPFGTVERPFRYVECTFDCAERKNHGTSLTFSTLLAQNFSLTGEEFLPS